MMLRTRLALGIGAMVAVMVAPLWLSLRSMQQLRQEAEAQRRLQVLEHIDRHGVIEGPRLEPEEATALRRRAIANGLRSRIEVERRDRVVGELIAERGAVPLDLDQLEVSGLTVEALEKRGDGALG